MEISKLNKQLAYQKIFSEEVREKRNIAPELICSANSLEISSASVFYNELSLADMAHIIMLIETETIPKNSGEKLLEALLKAHVIPFNEFPLNPSYGDFYNCREHYIREIAPDVAGWHRVARARREATNIAYLLAVRRRLLALLGGLEQLALALIRKAKKHIDTVMPDYTYLHQAQPTTFAHYLLGFVYSMLRDFSRLRACFKRINLSPGGLGSVNGSRLPLDRKRLAELLGFDGLACHTRDAMWQADMPIEVAASVVAMMMNIDRLAEDLQVWTTQEYNLVEMDDKYCRDSVIMPQKKNPYSLTYLRGLTNVIVGHLVAMANVARTPSGQPDNRIFTYVEIPKFLDKSLKAVQLMTGIMNTLKVNISVMASKFKLGYSQATDLAEVMMLTTGLPYQTMHAIVGEVVHRANKRNISCDQISIEMINEVCKEVLGQRLDLKPETINKALDPYEIICTRRGIGGAAKEPMREMIRKCQSKVAKIKSWREEREDHMRKAEVDIVSHVKKIVKNQKN